MPRVKFLKDFDWKPIPQQTYGYKAGSVWLVKDECARQAIKAGVAELTELPSPPSGLVDAIQLKRKRTRGKPNGNRIPDTE